MFFSFGWWLNFRTTLEITGNVGRWNYILFRLVFKHEKYGNQVWRDSSATNTVLRVRQDGEREARGGKAGEELGWKCSKFPSNSTPLSFLNTDKFTFFPRKSAWTVCFGKTIFHWQSRVPALCNHRFGRKAASYWGNQRRGGDSGGSAQTTAQHPTAFYSLSPK